MNIPFPFISRKNRLRHFIRDGMWASVCEGVAESNFDAFSTLLSASPSTLSFLASSEGLVGCWFQLWTIKLVRLFNSRKRFVLFCVFCQILTLLLMITLTFFSVSPLLFMAFTFVFSVIGTVSGPVWNSWISDLLPSRRRGFCFGVRNQFTYPAQFTAILLSGFILQRLQQPSNNFGEAKVIQLGFCMIFLLGLGAKVLSLFHLYLQPEINSALPKQNHGPVKLILSGYRDIQIRKLIWFFTALGFAVGISGSCQTSYMLRNLHLSYFPYASVIAAMAIGRFIGAPFIGRVVDQFGYGIPFLISTLVMPAIPLGWTLFKSIYGILAIQLLSGLIWAAFDLSVFCLLTESTTLEKRQGAFSLKQVFWTSSNALGCLGGGLIFRHSNSLELIFLTSSLARLAAGLFIIPIVIQLFKSEDKIAPI